MHSTGTVPHSGTGYLLTQASALPFGPARAPRTRWCRFRYVEVLSTSGAVLGTLATYSNLNALAGQYVQRGPFNLLPWKGQTVRVQVRATNDQTLGTTFRVDDVSLH